MEKKLKSFFHIIFSGILANMAPSVTQFSCPWEVNGRLMGAIRNDNKERVSLLVKNIIAAFERLANIVDHGGQYSCPSDMGGKREILGMTIRRE
jgi:hypothetical protein